MSLLAEMESQHGVRTTVGLEDDGLESLARSGRIDAYIVATEDGFSPLGSCRSFLSTDLGIPEQEIKRLADWNRFKNPRVSLIALQSRRCGSHLLGVILAASETSASYERFAIPRYGRPYRDFYYNVTYEAINYASKTWGAQHLALSHLSGSGSFHEDIATCNAEALAHYCDANPLVDVESFMFVECCIDPEHLSGIFRLNAEAHTGKHHPILVETEQHEGYVLVNLEWENNSVATEGKRI